MVAPWEIFSFQYSERRKGKGGMTPFSDAVVTTLVTT